MNYEKLEGEELVVELVSNATRFLDAFEFMIRAAVSTRDFQGSIEVHLSVERNELGLAGGQKPGDIDLLMIPIKDETRCTDQSMAVEVKRNLLKVHNRGRTPSPSGWSQVLGASKDGFPYVGLLHVNILEPSDKKDWVQIPVVGRAEAGVWQTEEERVAEFKDQTISVDPDFTQATLRSDGRIIHSELPSHIGFHSHTLLRTQRGIWSGAQAGRAPSRNPMNNPSLLQTMSEWSRKPQFVLHFKDDGLTIGHV